MGTIEKSFYDWCIETNHKKYLDLWDYELNSKKPNTISYCTKDKYYFKCENGKHDSYLRSIWNVVNSKDLLCPICNSFGQWCINEGCQEYLNLWDDELNNCTPFEVLHSSGKKFYFKCGRGLHESELFSITHITSRGQLILCRKCNSFGQFLIDNFGEDAIEKYWSDKNQDSPFNYSVASSKKIWIKCQEKEYHDDYQVRCCSFKNGTRCPSCKGLIVHPMDSFAQYHIDHTDKDFLTKYWCDDNLIDPWTIRPFSNDAIIKIQCQDVKYHQFEITAANYSCGEVCPYCNKKRVHKLDSLGMKFPDVLKYWSTKNNLSPFNYKTKSNQKVWLKCENNIHEDYQRTISEIFENKNCRCPECSRERNESFLQEKVRKYIESLGYKILHENNCSITPINPKTNYFLPYDNEIVDLKLIIEVNGIQHYQVVGFHKLRAKQTGNTPEQEFEYQQWKDEYKKDYALSHGYFYLTIPYWTNDENETWKSLINNKINAIKMRRDCG